MDFLAQNEVFDKPGRAINLDLANYDNILIQGCKFISSGGIFIQAKPGCKIRILNNVATNILKTKDMEYAQFCQISGLTPNGLPRSPCVIDCQIVGNSITNEPGKCDVEDNINLIAVSGSAKRPIVVTGNTIHGAYPLDMSEKSLNDYSGGGIICDRGTCWAQIRGNNVFDTTNYGISIAAGRFNVVFRNTLKATNARNIGICCWNAYKGDPFGGHSVRRNAVEWLTPSKPPGRNDVWIE